MKKPQEPVIGGVYSSTFPSIGFELGVSTVYILVRLINRSGTHSYISGVSDLNDKYYYDFINLDGGSGFGIAKYSEVKDIIDGGLVSLVSKNIGEFMADYGITAFLGKGRK